MGEKKRLAEKCRTQCRSGFTEKNYHEANNLGVKYITVYAFFNGKLETTERRS